MAQAPTEPTGFPRSEGLTSAIRGELERMGMTGGGSGGGGSSQLEARIAKLESDVEYIKRDVSEIRNDTREHRQEFGKVRENMQAEFGKVREERHADFRILFGAIIATAIGLAGLIAHGFKWL